MRKNHTILKNEVEGICVSLETDGARRFYAALDAAGSISRSGSGKMTDKHDDLFIGITKDHLFEKLIPIISETLFQGIGQSFNIPFQDDIPCSLTISFQIKEKIENIIIKYGYNSGLPDDVRAFLRAILDLTEPWYQLQKQKKHGE